MKQEKVDTDTSTILMIPLISPDNTSLHRYILSFSLIVPLVIG